MGSARPRCLDIRSPSRNSAAFAIPRLATIMGCGSSARGGAAPNTWHTYLGQQHKLPLNRSLCTQASRASHFLRSELVAEFAQHLLARFDVGLGFDSLALDPVDNAENPSPALGVGHDDLHRIGRRAVDGANLWHGFDCVKDIDRESAGHEDNETMSATQRQGVLLRELDEFRVVSSPTDQSRPT